MCVHACEWVCPWVCTVYVLSCQTRILWKLSTFYINIRQWARSQDELISLHSFLAGWKLKFFGLIWVDIYSEVLLSFFSSWFKEFMCVCTCICMLVCMQVCGVCMWVRVGVHACVSGISRNMWTWMHWFARTIITKPQTKWIILQNLIFFWFWGLEDQEQGTNKIVFPFRW